MLSAKIKERIDEQINREMFSAYLYMAMSAKMADWGYKGAAKWLMTQYHEEMFHAMKFFTHLQDRGETPNLKAIAQPVLKDADFKTMFEHVLEHEKTVTASIRELLELALAEKDYATEGLLRWYVDEQVEEERNAEEILQNIELLGEGPQGLFMLNIELGKRSLSVPSDFTALG